MQASHSKTSFNLVRRLASGMVLAGLLTACGYKGPLYMPPPPAPEESLTTPPAPARSLPAETPDASATSATPSPVQ